MQRVTSMLPSWNQTKTGSKKGFDKVWGWADKLGAPINRLTNKIGSEAFWPMTLDKESDKAARILRSFCKDGFYAEEEYPSQDGPKQKQKVLKKIPQKVIQEAVGLAIFTTMRSGLWVSGAGGSGVLVARLEDGSWSPPSGILLHTAGLGFLVGVDIYDCVVVINSRKTLESFTKIRATLGGEISAVAGPVGIGGVLENDGKWKQANKPVFTYLKSRGFYAGVQVDGTVIIERKDENERFYHQKIGVSDIMAGKVRHPPYEIKMLMETIKAAEGRTDVDTEMMEELENQPAPGDVEIEAPGSVSVFGIPEIDDPDPFGVLALEKIGLEIREAGTKSRPDSGQFAYNPSPTSPIYSTFHRRSMDTLNNRSSRASLMSMMTTGTNRNSIDRAMVLSIGTQTDENLPEPSPRFTKNRRRSSANMNMSNRIAEEEIVTSPEDLEKENEFSVAKIHVGSYRSGSSTTNNSYSGSTVVTAESSPALEMDKSIVEGDNENDEAEEGDEYPYAYEEPVIYEAAKLTKPSAREGSKVTGTSTLMPQVVNVVSIAKRIPPPLPPRSPRRPDHADMASGRSSDEEDEVGGLGLGLGLGDKEGFETVDLTENLPEKEEVLENTANEKLVSGHEEKKNSVDEVRNESEVATPMPVVPGSW